MNDGARCGPGGLRVIGTLWGHAPLELHARLWRGMRGILFSILLRLGVVGVKCHWLCYLNLEAGQHGR